jgi:CHAT domain-containing protein/tetratricopeptide (TPR) repeat protein
VTPRLAPLFLALAVSCGPAEPERAPDVPLSIDTLLARGERVYLAGVYDTARTLWTAALDRSRQERDSLAQARALTWLGLAAWRQGDYAEARRLGEEALALKRRIARDADLFKSFNALGLLAWNEGRLADATELFGQASAAARAAGDLKGIAAASGNLALVQTELGEFEEARRGFDSMLVAGRALREARIEGNALTNLGMLAVRVGDPALALPLLDSALARYRAAAYPTGEQNALGQLGTAYAALGRPALALAVLDSALVLSRRQGLRQDEASNLEAMAELYRDVGDDHRALDLYARAAPINRDLGLAVEAGADLRSVAEIHARLGAMEAAREAGERALAAHRAAAARFEELTDLLLLADIADRAGESGRAAEHIAAARRLAGELDVRLALAEVAVAEARLADRSGRPEGVLAALRGAAAAVAASGYGLEEEALRLEARALARLGRLDSAAAVGRRAVAALERIRGNLQSGELRTSYLADRQGVYADLADVLRRLGRTDEAFEVADAARGRVLLEGLAGIRRNSAAGGAVARTLQESDGLLRTIAALQEQVRSAEAEAGDDSSATARLRFLWNRVAGARREYEELAIRVQEVASPAATLLGAGRPRAAAILPWLRADEAILEYQPAGDSLLIFIVRRAGLRVVAAPLPRGGLLSRVRLARELIAVRGDSGERARPVLRGLGDLLIGPARQRGALEGVRALVVVPHGVLAYLPFAALVDGETGRYLVQEFEILTLPSAASLAALRARGGSTAAAVQSEVFAPDPAGLPASRTEAAAVGRELPNATVRIGHSASEVAARDALASGALVHLAAHGELNVRNPMFSWIRTAPTRSDDPSRDGRLEVHEILGIPVRSPLVFLSGCETGLGTAGSTGFAPGEDFATLARAFLYAGAGNVVATLWRVDDRGAAAFAEAYYRRLGDEGPVAALAGAQRALAADRRYQAPYYWAGYTVAGSGIRPNGLRASRSRPLSVSSIRGQLRPRMAVPPEPRVFP